MSKDDSGNAHVGDVTALDCKNTLIYANHQLVAAIGLESILVVETAYTVLVTDNKKSREVKAIVSSLNRQK